MKRKCSLTNWLKQAQFFMLKQLNISNDDVLIHVVRTRNVNQKVKILDEDYFLTSIVSNISDSVAKDSIYHYLETQLD